MILRNAMLAIITLAGGMFASGEVSATTISFSGLSDTNGTPFTTYAEGGFVVTTVSGQFFQGQLFGNLVPSLFAGPVQNGSVNDTLSVSRSGGELFDLSSFDIAANNGSAYFTLTGLLNGVQQYIVSGTQAGNNGGPFTFKTITSPDASIPVTNVNIMLNIFGSSANLDNIVVSAVPETTTFLLLGTALVSLGVLRRRGKVQIRLPANI